MNYIGGERGDMMWEVEEGCVKIGFLLSRSQVYTWVSMMHLLPEG